MAEYKEYLIHLRTNNMYAPASHGAHTARQHIRQVH